MDLGPHAAFILAAYAAMTVILSGLVAWLVWNGRRHLRALQDLEGRGVRRRSSPSSDRQS
jgi:heme exporter protein D